MFLSVSTTDDDDDDDDDDTDDYDYAARSCPSSYDQSSGKGQLLSRRYCTHSGGCSVRPTYRPIVPRRFGGFV